MPLYSLCFCVSASIQPTYMLVADNIPARRWRTDEMRAHLRNDHDENPDTLQIIVDKTLADLRPIKSTQKRAKVEFNPNLFQDVLDESKALRQHLLEQLQALPASLFRELDGIDMGPESISSTSTYAQQDFQVTPPGQSMDSSTDIFRSPSDDRQHAEHFDNHLYVPADLMSRVSPLRPTDVMGQSPPILLSREGPRQSANEALHPVLDTATGKCVLASWADVEKYFQAPSAL